MREREEKKREAGEAINLNLQWKRDKERERRKRENLGIAFNAASLDKWTVSKEKLIQLYVVPMCITMIFLKFSLKIIQ